MTTSAKDFGTWASPEVQRCPIPHLNRLLEEAPVYRDEGTGMVWVSRYEDINFVNSNPDIFSSRTPIMINRKTSVSEEVARRYKERGWPEEHVLAFADPPEHTLHRALVDKVFTPSYTKQLEPYALAIIDDLIDHIKFCKAVTRRNLECKHRNVVLDYLVIERSHMSSNTRRR